VTVLDHPRATASINFNITELIDLGNMRNSDTPTTDVGNTLNSSWNDANVGDIRGNRMFYTNDCMASDQIP